MHKFLGIFSLLLAGLGSMSSDVTASTRLERATTNVAHPPKLDRSQPTPVVAVSYRIPVLMVDATSRTSGAIAEKSIVSAKSKADIWTTLIAILGLISMRPWFSGKKRSSTIY